MAALAEVKKIPFNFTYFAMKLLGKNLYSNPWTAISEIVANGIDANADNVYVLVDMRNKEHAIVEIFDDGKGMSFSDLNEKYTLIGRNKRLSEENISGKTLGRKGIGKLAALYLSPQYYLCTKAQDNSDSIWVVDTRSIKDSDIPALIEVRNDKMQLVATQKWSELPTGTMIHLSDVDLRKIGPERLKSLPVILADYYLETTIKCNIQVCVLTSPADQISFSPIKKEINFDTLYGIFDNTEHGFKKHLKSAVYLTKQTVYPEVDVPRPTVILDDTRFNCEDTIELTDLNGEVRELPYKMTGWIGIHCSLDNDILTRNSPHAKRLQHHPNALRLYVRGKLAVNNLMNYVASSQALANYIEGEISFDVLDDDAFEDASTSNREGYSINDPRIKVLINIVGKIISALIAERNKIGKTINDEIDAIRKRAENEEIARREAAEKKQVEAEKRAAEESLARKQVEEERDTAERQCEQAHQRLFVLENNFVSDGERYKHGIHLAVNFAKEIRGTVIEFDEKLFANPKEALKLIMDIDRSAEKIERLPSYVDTATFKLTSPNIRIDILQLIREYIESKGNKKLSYSFEMPISCVVEVDFAEIIMLVENIISNAVKASATTLSVVCKAELGKTQIDFIDNGNGLAKKYIANPDAIFELGETTSIGGYGIGAFHMREIVENLGGSIHAIPNKGQGLTIRVVI